MIVLFLITAITSVILFYVKEILDIHEIGRAPISTIHNYIGLAFIIVMLIHIILHYKWIINVSKNIIKK